MDHHGEISLSDASLRHEIRDMVAEARNAKEDVANHLTCFAGIVAPITGLAVIWGMAATTTTSWWALSGIGLVVLIVTFVAPFLLQETLQQRKIKRTGKRYKSRFPVETGDYGRAIMLLKGIKTDSQVERLLLKVMGSDVQFTDDDESNRQDNLEREITKPGTPKPPIQDDNQNAQAPNPTPTPDYIPLDPYGPTASDEVTPLRPKQ